MNIIIKMKIELRRLLWKITSLKILKPVKMLMLNVIVIGTELAGELGKEDQWHHHLAYIIGIK
jgi:hypothetical protein